MVDNATLSSGKSDGMRPHQGHAQERPRQGDAKGKPHQSDAKEKLHQDDAKRSPHQGDAKVRSQKGRYIQPQVKSHSVNPKRVLKEARACNLKKQRNDFTTRYHDEFRKEVGSNENILHELANSKDSWSAHETKTFLPWFLRDYYGLLKHAGLLRYPPLHLALTEENHPFVEAVLTLDGLKNLPEVLELTSPRGNALHVAIQVASPFVRLIIAKSRLSVLEGKCGEFGDTPLHIAMRAKVGTDDINDVLVECEEFEHAFSRRAQDQVQALEPVATVELEHRRSSDYRASSTKAVASEPSVQRSVTSEQSVKGAVTSEQSVRGAVASDQSVQGVVASEQSVEGALASEQNLEGAVTSDRSVQGAVASAQNVEGGADTTEQMPKDSQLQTDELVELLIHKCPAALQHRNNAGRTPYQERERFMRNSDEVRDALQNIANEDEEPDKWERAFRMVFIEDLIASYIRSYCVHEFDRDRITRCLYHPGEGRRQRFRSRYQLSHPAERHIEFDLAGLPHPSIPQSYLDRLANHLQFESILKYVALPRMTIETPKQLMRSKE